MGMDVGGAGGNVKKDINVTPLVDVVLVLLIIFLVAMPVRLRNISIEVPRKLDTDTERLPKNLEQLTVELRADGSVLFQRGANEEVITRAEVARKLREILENRTTEKIVFVDFELTVPYKEVVSLMDSIRGAGADKIAIKTKEPGQPGHIP